MILADAVLGTTVTTRLRERNATPILRIGSDTFTRRDLAGVECYNFLAAQRLSDILNEHLNAKNLKDVFERIPPSALALPRLGAISLAVLGAAFEAKGLGGDNPLLRYVEKHAPENVAHAVVTFHTMKDRANKDLAQERKALKSRKLARRNQAHRLRVGRLEAAQAAN